MKTVHINTYDIEGGAARAAYRLHRGLLGIKVESTMLVQKKFGGDPTVLGPGGKAVKAVNMLRPHLDKLPLRFYRDRKDTPWAAAWLPHNVRSTVDSLKPDVVHLHWICDGYIPISAITGLKKPLVWTLHDSWAFTGGCHIPFDCIRYRDSCGSCPQIKSGSDCDLSRWVWKRKMRYWRDLNLTVVAPSTWLAGCAKSSSIFNDIQVEVIPNGLDLTVFKQLRKETAREILNLPQDKKLVLFGAVNSTTDRNKGFTYLQEALKTLTSDGWDQKAALLVFGAQENPDSQIFGFPARYFGHLYDDTSLALLYNAADVMVIPSIQEAFGQTATEAMACGTPVVAFAATGLLDIVDHQQNGYLAKPYDPADMARGIAGVLADDQIRDGLSRRAREKVERAFDVTKVAKRYADLYQEILGR